MAMQFHYYVKRRTIFAVVRPWFYVTFARAWFYYVSSYGRPVDYYTNGQIQKCKHPEDTTLLTYYADLPTLTAYISQCGSLAIFLTF